MRAVSVILLVCIVGLLGYLGYAVAWPHHHHAKAIASPATTPTPATTSISVPATTEPTTTTAEEPTRTAEPTSTTQPEPTTGTIPPEEQLQPFDVGGLPSIARQLSRQLGRSPQVIQVLVSSDFAQFDVRSASSPAHVGSYLWRAGTFGSPTPDQTIGAQPIAAQAFALSAIPLGVVHRLSLDAPRAHIAGGAVTTIILRREVPFSRRVIWYVNVGNGATSAQLRATADGHVYQVLR